MTSFELFNYQNINNIYMLNIFLYCFLLKYIMRDKTNHFLEKKIKYFASNYGIITSIIIKLCKKSCRKEKVGGA